MRAVILLVLALAGCAHERVVVETVEVRVPVSVPCMVTLPADPDRPTQQTPPAADIFEAMKRALAEIERWQGWAERARGAAGACQIPEKSPR